ncbi:Fc.00g005290.m01.CDS01 [Cosmosporella sp. VM-42]
MAFLSLQKPNTYFNATALSRFVTQPWCSGFNLWNHERCMEKPVIPCPWCQLISYCSEDCRTRHWTIHKTECAARPSEEDEDLYKQPKKSFIKNSVKLTKKAAIEQKLDSENVDFFAKYQATDVIELEANEGLEREKELSLLFLGRTHPFIIQNRARLTQLESSLRHLVQSVLKLSPSKTQKKRVINATLNEEDPRHLVRTVLATLLLTDLSHDPALNAEAATHLWYSAMLPKHLLEHIQRVAGPLRNAFKELDSLRSGNPAQTFTSTLFRGTVTMTVELMEEQWDVMRMFLDSPDMPLELAQASRRGDVTLRHDLSTEQQLGMTRGRVAGMNRWIEDGLLLPYGHPRSHFDTLNPIFFPKRGGYPTGGTAEPLSEWSCIFLDQECGVAHNDAYGKMFFYVCGLFQQFQKRIRKVDLGIRLVSMSLTLLANYLPKRLTENDGEDNPDGCFDRIEAGPYFERVEFHTMISSAKLLAPPKQNPHAKLLTMTRKSVMVITPTNESNFKKEQKLLTKRNGTALDDLAPPLGPMSLKGNPRARARRTLGLLMWRKWDEYSEEYVYHPGSHKGITQCGLAELYKIIVNLELQSQNTVVPRWANRLVHEDTDTPSKQHFNRWLGWPDTAPQRWLEWKKIVAYTSKPKVDPLELAEDWTICLAKWNDPAEFKTILGVRAEVRKWYISSAQGKAKEWREANEGQKAREWREAVEAKISNDNTPRSLPEFQDINTLRDF